MVYKKDLIIFLQSHTSWKQKLYSVKKALLLNFSWTDRILHKCYFLLLSSYVKAGKQEKSFFFLFFINRNYSKWAYLSLNVRSAITFSVTLQSLCSVLSFVQLYKVLLSEVSPVPSDCNNRRSAVFYYPGRSRMLIWNNF